MTKLPPDAEHDEVPMFAQWQPVAAGCPPPHLLFPAVEGVLPADVAAPIVAHVEACPLCQELSRVEPGDAADPTLPEAARLRARILPAAPRRPVSFRMIPYAAAAAITLVAGGLVLARLASRPAAPSPTAAQAAPPAAATPVFVLALNKPVTELPPESLTLRSASPDRYASALAHALEPYERGDYAEAVARLTLVARDHPSRPHPAYYLGLSTLLGGLGDATADLERARTLAAKGTSLRADATWYLAVAYERHDRRESAVATLNDLCAAPGPRQAQACAGVRALTNR